MRNVSKTIIMGFVDGLEEGSIKVFSVKDGVRKVLAEEKTYNGMEIEIENYIDEETDEESLIKGGIELAGIFIK